VTPDDPQATGTSDGEPVQVSLTVQSVQHVLAVPVAALLALAGGGYGLEVIEPSGHHVLVPVRTGVFAGGEVEVNGGGIAAGARVAVAQ
jgi:secreted protein with Ig-like and vWFA domain